MGDPKEFTRRLLAQIGGGQGPQAGAGRAAPMPQAVPKPRENAGAPDGGLLVAADGTCANGGALVREALSLRRFGVAVTVLADAPLAQRLGRLLPPGTLYVPEGPLAADAFGAARVLLAASGPGQLAKAALGLRDTVAADALLCALWHGLAVYTDLSFARQDEDGKPCQNATVAALYQGYEQRLREMGVRHLSRGEVLAVLLPLLQRPEASASPGQAQAPAETGRVFITQRDVMAYTGPPEWVLPQRAVVTAAAKDEAARRNITLRRQGRP